MRAVVLTLFIFSAWARGEQCARRFAELSKTPRLTDVMAVLSESSEIGFVNETKGSYFSISTKDDLSIRFMTTGLFDLYKIDREGPLQICDTGDSLVVDGIGRRESLVIDGFHLLIGGDGPRQRYRQGPVPEHLK